MSLIFGYCRVSSDEQAAHGISIDAQREILTAYATMTQSTIRIYTDAGYSGKNTDRPDLRRMLSDLRTEEVESVVVWKLDRLSRSIRDTLTLIEDVFQPRRIRLISVTETVDTSTPSGRMMVNMMAAFAQLEREQDSDRVVMAHKHLAWDCRYLGGHVPPGYRVDDSGHFQLDPVAAPLVRHVFEMYLSHCGYTEILRFLNGNLPAFAPRQRPFNKSALKYLLHNEMYAGVYIRRMGQDKRSRITSPEIIRVPGGIPAIITPEQWRNVEMIRDTNKAEHTAATYASRRMNPLSGLVYCDVCKQPMSLNYGGKDRSGAPERYYTCKNKCVRPSRLEKTEASVFDAVDDLLKNADVLEKACRIANEYSRYADEDNRDEIANLKVERQEIAGKIARALSAIESQDNAPLSLVDDLRAYEKRTKEIDDQIADFRRATCVYDFEETLSGLRAVQAVKKEPPEKQKPVIQAAIRRVLISDEEIKILPAWHLGGGDEPPRPVCHAVKRR